ncbi:MAG: transglycosylase SLT domain-containing protein, partial [Thaumarchaeota archaeon]|nr:transglycosylase SLT domain-containing protein [Nitrososphaerota archaeon]
MLPRVRLAFIAGRKQLMNTATEYVKELSNEVRGKSSNIRNEYTRAQKEFRRVLRDMKRDVEGARGFVNSVMPKVKGANLQTLAGLAGMVESAAGSIPAQQSFYAAQLKIAYQNLVNARERVQELERGYSAAQIRKEIYGRLLNSIPGIVSDMDIMYHVLEDVGPESPFKDIDSLNQTLSGLLQRESAWIADVWAKHAVNRIRRFFGWLTIVARTGSLYAMGIGDIYHLIVTNLWAFLTGPWILGSAIVVAQFFFLSWWSPTPLNVVMLFGAPAIGLLLLTAVNMFTAKYPMEIFTHMICGVIMAYSVVIFLSALGWPPIGNASFYWWLAFMILGGIGAFQFYATGGFNAIVPLAVIIMIFGYASLGPYSGYVREIRDQVLTPLKFVWLNIKNTFQGIWLLVVNPTEWYARQQLMNVRPETPTEFPKGIEVTRLDAVPDSVPSRQKFYLHAVLENKGDQDARNIELKASCGGIEGYYEVEKELQRGLFGIQTEAGSGMTGGPHCEIQQDGYPKDYRKTLRPGEAQAVRFEFTAIGRTQVERAAEVVFAKPVVHIHYTYSTSSSLAVELATFEEIQRRQMIRKGERYYYNEIAKGKVGPAQFSLNVGPQPLEPGKEVILAASISNTRFDGSVILTRNSKIIINVPEIIGSNLNCEAATTNALASSSCSAGKCTLTMLNVWEIRAFEFAEVFPIYCRFTTATLLGGRPSITSLITGELIDYTFLKLEEKSVRVTAPLGIIPIGGARMSAQCADVYGATGTLTTIKNFIFQTSDMDEKYNKYADMIDNAVAETTVNNKKLGDYVTAQNGPQALIAAIITWETHGKWDPNAKNPTSGATGLMQVLVGGSTDPQENIKQGASILIEKFNALKDVQTDEENRIKLAAAAYNGGQGRILEAIRIAGSNKWEDISKVDTMTQAGASAEKAQEIIDYGNAVYELYG